MADYRILLAFPKSEKDLQENIRTKLEEELFGESPNPSSQVTVDWERNEADALFRFRNNGYALVISYLHLPADRKEPVREEEQRGLSFLHSIKDDNPDIPVILVVTAMDGKVYNAIKGYNDCIGIELGTKFDEDLMEYFKKFLFVCPLRKRTAHIDIVIDFKSICSTIVCPYQIQGAGFNIPGEICLNYETLDNFKADSKELEAAIGKGNWTVENWEQKFLRLGMNLSGAIFHDWKFMPTIQDVVQKVGGFENFRIRFELSEACHTIIFEALMDQNRNLFMLQAPMYRRIPYKISSGLTPLFMDPNSAPRNCLIIAADVQGYVEGLNKQDLEVGELPNLSEETSWLKEYLQAKVQGTVILLAQGDIPIGKTFKDQLLELLKKDKWDLVHFAGHSLYSKNKEGEDIGCLVLPGKDQGELLEISDLADYLREAKTRFLYLNSCHSTAAAMVFKLAEQEVPATMGFRWPIHDDQAFFYAQSFYQNLFAKRSLEESFFYSRKEMHQKYKDPRSSAALLLILQTP